MSRHHWDARWRSGASCYVWSAYHTTARRTAIVMVRRTPCQVHNAAETQGSTIQNWFFVQATSHSSARRTFKLNGTDRGCAHEMPMKRVNQDRTRRHDTPHNALILLDVALSRIVYTERVGSSNLSPPTNQIK